MDEDGPQAARSKRLAQTKREPVELPPPLQMPSRAAERSTVPVSTSTECPLTAPCRLELARLADDKAFLTQYVERLLNQLRTLLQKYGDLDQLKRYTDSHALEKAAAEDEDAQATLPAAPWLTSLEYTNPLFQAYDLKIHELERVMEENKSAINHIAARAESLAKENTGLRQELEAAGEKLVLRMQHEPKQMTMPSDDLSAMHENSEYLSEINERIDVLMSENNMLMEQVSLQDDELSAMKKELTDRDQQFQVMAQNFNQATLALQELRDSCASVRAEKNHCEQQLQQYAATMAQLEAQKEVLIEQANGLRTDRRNLDNQLEEYESLLSTVKKNAERKDEQFAIRYQNVCSRLRELGSVIDAKEKQTDELEEQNRGLQNELESVRQDCEGMLRVLTNMEKQLNQYCAREDAVAELEADCKEKMEEIILEKEQISTKEAQSRREIARLLERLRVQTADHLQENEDSIKVCTRRFESETRTRDEEINALNGEIVQLRVKLESVARHQKESEANLGNALRLSKEAADGFEKRIKQLAQRAAIAEETKEELSHLESECQQKLRAKELEVTKLRSDLREKSQDSSEKVSSLESELSIRRNEVRELKEQAEEAQRRIHHLHDELAKVKSECAQRITTELDTLHQEIRNLKAQVNESEYKSSQAKKESEFVVDTMRHERERVEVRYLAEVETLKARISTLKEERTRVEKARLEAESKCSVLTMQIQQLSRDLTEANELLSAREHACDDSDRKVAELSDQLASILSKQQQMFRQERDMRTTLERVALERNRMEREATMTRRKLEEYRSSTYVSRSHVRSRPEGTIDNNDRDKLDTSTKGGVQDKM